MPLFGSPNIARLQANRDVDRLIEALTWKNARVRAVAAKALGQIGDSRAIDPLAGASSDPDPAVRREASQSLAALAIRDGGRAIPALVDALKDKDRFVRDAVADDISRIGGRDAKRALAFLDRAGRKEEKRRPSVRLLADRRDFEGLIRALRQRHPFESARAADALVALGAEAIEPLTTAARAGKPGDSSGAGKDH